MKQSFPRYSVIVPVYMVEHYLPRLMDCFLAQSDPDFEVIFVNDCSPDNSATILESYARSDSRFRVLHQPQNMRQGAARNRGLDEAGGDFILFVDADDTFAPNYFERMHEAISSADADVAMCNPRIQYSDHSTMENCFAKMPGVTEKIFTHYEALKYFALHWGRGDYFYRVEPWAKIIRHDLIAHHHLRFYETYSEDVLFSTALSCLARRTCGISDTLYFYQKTGYSDLDRNLCNYLRNLPTLVSLINHIYHKYLDQDTASWCWSYYVLTSLQNFYDHIFKTSSSKAKDVYIETIDDLLAQLNIVIFDEPRAMLEFRALFKSLSNFNCLWIYEKYTQKFSSQLLPIYSNQVPVYTSDTLFSFLKSIVR